MVLSPLIDQLIHKLCCLPGIGPKSAQRMAFYLLERARPQGFALAKLLEQAMRVIGHCQRCHTLSETALCPICTNVQRDVRLLCVVEMPIDVVTIEQTGSYRGYYFVLMGHLSPLDGIGPEELGIHRFIQCINQYPPQEIILATNPTIEGDATAHYLVELLKPHAIKVSRIAHGVPLGGELEFVDSKTLSLAIAGRGVLQTLDDVTF